jgi:hypothetical protein
LNRPQRPPDPWSELARAHGLRDTRVTDGFVDRRARVLEGIVDEVPLVIDTCMESSRDRFVPHTRVSGRVIAPVATQISVLTRDPLVEPPQGRLVELGDRDFEGRFFVKADPPEPAIRVMGEDLRGRLLGFPHPLMFIYERDMARLFWEGREADVVTLGLALDAVVAACSFRVAVAYR